MVFASSKRRILLYINFYMYLSFTSATYKLWVSYVLSNNDGNTKTASSMINRMAEFFPHLQEPILLTEPDELQQAARFITTNTKTRAPLTAQLARYMRGYKMDGGWWKV